MTSISYICSLTCDCQRLQYHHIHKSSSHLCIWTALCLLKTLQSLCLLYLQTFTPKNPLHAALKFVKAFSNCSFLPNYWKAPLPLLKGLCCASFWCPCLLWGMRGTEQNRQTRLCLTSHPATKSLGGLSLSPSLFLPLAEKCV